MRVGLQAWGSEGDLRPVVALAAGLKRLGHEVRVDLTAVDGTDYTATGRQLWIPLRMLPEKMDFRLDEVANTADSTNPLKISRELVDRSFFPHLDLLYETALDLCRSSDVVIWHYASWYTKAAALKTGVPDVALHLFPGLAPTRTAPPGGLPNLGPLNPALWSLARLMLDLQFRKRPAQFFQRHGLPKLKHVLPELLFSERLNLHGLSPVLCPPAPDWTDAQKVCGQFTLPETAGAWKPSEGLQTFLEEGSKPALLSLGSMEHFAPRRAQELLTEGARKAGVRAIIQTKRAHEERREGDLYFLPWAPHAALLAHCSLMVHHGGAGTSHSALRSGVPAVVVPVILEQQIWADRLRRVGVTGKSVPFWKSNSDRLAARIREVADSESMRIQASRLGNQMRQEDGIAQAGAELKRATR